ncbi:hypothetical protein D9757_009284 [Collybiopsis confluens]|uniref:glucan endo-1,3-beta-D-glucosidase n=1 Tax=Collybiopsis confluens TaxID=2823264 RepID=A0A8H5H9U2_9AGAR|nr:hypothetical protein D9757_009284 [Collybiopsis confluens]
MYSQANGQSHSTDLLDYYDHIPPAHRISAFSSLSGQQQNIPMSATAGSSVEHLAPDSYSDTPVRTRPHFGDRRGDFVEAPHVQEKNRSSRSRRRWIIGGIAVVGVAALVGIVAGVIVSRTKSSSSSSSSSNDDTISSDPSRFTKDSSLKQSFWGIAYTPEGTLYPDCGAKQTDVITDIQLLSQLTTRIRLYGADCNTTALVLNAIKLTQVNMSVYIANYPQSDDNGEAYNRQRDAIKSAIETYGSDHIAGVTVGNEFILNYLNANSGTDPNSAVGNAGAKILNQYIADTKSMLSDLSLSSMKIGNADAGSYFNNLVLEQVNYGMANVHPWFANVSIDQAAGWTSDFFLTNDVALSQKLPNTPEMSIAETGWPTKSSDVGNESNGPSTASEENLQKFLNTFVCQANANGTEYFFFEFFDEKWKDDKYGGVEVQVVPPENNKLNVKNDRVPIASHRFDQTGLSVEWDDKDIVFFKLGHAAIACLFDPEPLLPLPPLPPSTQNPHVHLHLHLHLQPQADPEIKQPLHPSIISRLDPDYISFHNKYILHAPPPDTLPWDPIKMRGTPAYAVGMRKPLEVGKIEDFEFGNLGRKVRVRARAYTPHGEAPMAGWPIIIYFHGGGWTLGGIDSEQSILTNFCVGAKCVALTVDYRLAPEHKFPAAVEDAIEALQWVITEGEDLLHIDTSNIAIGGQSAGGNLSAVLALKSVEDSFNTPPLPHPLKLQLLIVPVLDLTASEAPGGRWERNKHAPFLTPNRTRWFKKMYFDDEEDSSFKWEASPIFAPDELLRKVPKAWIGAGEFDVLCDDAQAYAERLKECGVEVECVVYEGGTHINFMLDGALRT